MRLCGWDKFRGLHVDWMGVRVSLIPRQTHMYALHSSFLQCWPTVYTDSFQSVFLPERGEGLPAMGCSSQLDTQTWGQAQSNSRLWEVQGWPPPLSISWPTCLLWEDHYFFYVSLAFNC